MTKNIRTLAVCTLFSALAAGALLQSTSAQAQTQDYPNKPIKVVVPFVAGGAVDALARVFGAQLQETLKVPVVIENRAGAGGNIAAAMVAKSDPDGYTILQTTNGHAISPALYKNLRYDPVKDFAPVTQLIDSTIMLVAAPNLEAKDVRELIALAKAKPGVLNYGSTGVGNPLHLAMEMLKHATGTNIQMVPFRGDAPLTAALLSGDVQIAMVPFAAGRPQVTAGKLRGLGVTSPQRWVAMKDMPTIAEQGVPGFEASSWQGYLMPAGTPRAIVERIQKEVKAAMEKPAVRDRLDRFGVVAIGSTPDEFDAKIKADMKTFANIIKDAKIPQVE
jgi:tripartite-type tricarboxylate transporter receptor subunit TctC